ncbi:beta-ribofuranosylaminobenzene 5'-phosphate synthase family protein [Sulfuracidifex tepidarius]|uniref:Beta-ribofuranosylaminobenzene 5'-phosphate synthase n=1 Tax=Sulfuracidifex tepidarius TaxID=1294262 RepID=A0A510DUN7_9CREN|nr:beta-ribofuranosylaminobenzene 5'-phosphate synthase family protein [Sulfuracidifex tepidarius]BBG23932.1 Beta-ribofuranosylaminobenzene 5'-phosphate synthase [Sulfuracidifex tepidarius]BBG26687.1 Beta-ribofuranosylaminobenzene 5'-phosphate synthase [Sulfuracidifex tepidarius]
MIEVQGLSRIHITLINMDRRLNRIDGGVGIALKEPRVVVSTGNCMEFPLDLDFKTPGICVKEDYPEHVGLGHTTQFRLSLAKLASEYNHLPYSVKELASKVKRGTTSGVGIYAFHYGGLVLDGGHSLKVKKDILPSDFADSPPPALLARMDFPWKIYINIPRGKKVFGREELDFFKSAKPENIDELSRVVLMGLLPSVAERDLEGALDSIRRIQTLGFKKLEVSLQSEEVKTLMRNMEIAGFPGGLSSFGPLVYTFLSSRREGEELVSRFGGSVVEPNNEGAKVRWITTNS